MIKWQKRFPAFFALTHIDVMIPYAPRLKIFIIFEDELTAPENMKWQIFEVLDKYQ